MSRSVDEVLRLARAADPTTRIDLWRIAITELGDPGIERIAAWLEDPRDGPFAVSVIAWMGDHGHKSSAIRALRTGRSAATSEEVRRHVDAALLRLGVTVPSPGRPPSPPLAHLRGVKLAPPYKVVHHVVLDHLAESGTRWGALYLFECGRWFSEEWVLQRGGLLDPSGQPICDQCNRALGQGA